MNVSERNVREYNNKIKNGSSQNKRRVARSYQK